MEKEIKAPIETTFLQDGDIEIKVETKQSVILFPDYVKFILKFEEIEEMYRIAKAVKNIKEK